METQRAQRERRASGTEPFQATVLLWARLGAPRDHAQGSRETEDDPGAERDDVVSLIDAGTVGVVEQRASADLQHAPVDARQNREVNTACNLIFGVVRVIATNNPLAVGETDRGLQVGLDREQGRMDRETCAHQKAVASKAAAIDELAAHIRPEMDRTKMQEVVVEPDGGPIEPCSRRVIGGRWGGKEDVGRTATAGIERGIDAGLGMGG